MSVRIAFLGTAEFAVAVLRRLAAAEMTPVVVVTPPDRRRGRGRRIQPPPVAEAARELGVEPLQTESVNRPEVVDAVRSTSPVIAVVCAFGQLIRAPLLGELEMLNVHPSLLPRWRGAAPIERSILAGDAETGVTIMRVTEGLDSGPISLQRAVAIEPGEDCGALSGRLAELGGELVIEALRLRADGKLSYADQDDALATYADKIRPGERRLDPRRPAVELARAVRALNPHIGTYLELAEGARLGVRRADAGADGLGPGELAGDGGELRLGCAGGVLRLVEVQPAGRSAMPAAAYLRGHPIPALAGP